MSGQCNDHLLVTALILEAPDRVNVSGYGTYGVWETGSVWEIVTLKYVFWIDGQRGCH